MKLSKLQLKALQDAKNRVEQGSRSVTVGGLAGTGKTTLLGHLHSAFGLEPHEIAYCAFTGKAAAVINRKYPQAHATTIHKLIYLARDFHCEDCPAGKKKGARCHSVGCPDCGVMYTAKEELPSGVRLIAVDEASMVPETIYTRLLMYGRPIVWIGDHGQLAPIRSTFNLMEEPDIRLEKIHRHAAGSPILQMAMEVRATGEAPRRGTYGEHGEVTVRRTSMMPGFHTSEWERGTLAILCPTNAMRVTINKSVRRAIGLPEGAPVKGDRVICLRNNDGAGIYNGLTGHITELAPSWSGQEHHAGSVRIDDEDRTYVGRMSVEQFNSKTTLEGIDRDEMDLWDYGYGLTVHKAQGSEYDRVVLVVNLAKVPQHKDRWLYTAITRAKKKLEIIYPD